MWTASVGRAGEAVLVYVHAHTKSWNSQHMGKEELYFPYIDDIFNIIFKYTIIVLFFLNLTVVVYEE